MNAFDVLFGRFLPLCAILTLTTFAQNPAPSLTEIRVPAGSSWRYYNQDVPPSSNWMDINFHQSGWPEGRAQLGYGEGDEATVTRTSPPPHPVTAYFRHSFLAPTNLPITRVRLLRDDGAVVYLNGREILRDNMPAGEITPTTLASETVGGDGENQFREFNISPVALVETTNVVAVEVHQSNVSSSDLSFDLELIASVPEPGRPLVGIRAPGSQTSEPIPNALVAPGVFEVYRRDSVLSAPLRVYLVYEGTASASDYEALPTSIRIPAGESSATFNVLPKSDALVEGSEVVIARIVQRESTDPDEANRPYDIEPEHGRAEVKIADEDTGDLPVVSLSAVFSETSEPGVNIGIRPGRFQLRRTGSTDLPLSVAVRYEGTATAEVDYLPVPETITFAAGANETNILITAKEDTLVEPVETVVANLLNVPTSSGQAPSYVVDPAQNSGTVRIFDRDTPSEATLRITEPASGAEIQFGRPITVSAVAIDPLGYIPRVEFYADGTRIGVSEIAFLVPPEPGTPITHTIVWSNAPAGEHVLVARAKDSRGRAVTSPEIKIRVTGLNDRTFVSIAVTDPLATEFSPNVDAIDLATFEISRSGPTNNDLTVFFSVHGTAKEGADYRALPETILIRAGQRSATLTIVPLSDLLTVVEPMETVGVRLEPSRDARPIPMYEISPGKDKAGAVIFEREQAAGVAFVFPDENARFEPNEPASLLVAAFHPTQDATHLDFLLDGEKIGSSDVIVPPNEPGGLVFHALEWRGTSTAGLHQLKAVAVFESGLHIESQPLPILVGPGTDVPIVSVRFIPHQTTEPWPDADFAPGSFEFRRSGPTNGELAVFFNVGGSATEGADYESLGDHIIIPAGELASQRKVRAVDDILVEGDESVVVTLLPEFVSAGAAPRYVIDPEHKSASLTILDNDTTNGVARIEITKPREGQVIPLGTPIELEAVAVDPKGYIPRLEFYAGDRLIGVSEIVFVRAPDPGTPIHHSIVWSNAPAGEHQLTARGIDSSGNTVVSPPVRIVVRSVLPNPLIIALEAVDREGAEPGPDGTNNPVVFRIFRVSGPTNAARIWIGFSGSAEINKDYADVDILPVLPAGQRSMDIVIRPLADNLREGNESVVLTIRAWSCDGQIDPAKMALLPFALLPDAYCVLGNDRAEAVIRDSSPETNAPPKVSFYTPRNGAVFEPGQRIPIGVQAIDPGGQIVQFDLFIKDQLAWRTNGPSLGFTWSNAPAGEHTLRAIATDNLGAKGDASIRILVRESSSSFVERDLPINYAPGVPFTVALHASPPAGTQAWGAEDQPPRGWEVSEISQGGIFDPVTGKVKFGYFTENRNAQTLTYRVKPPANVSGQFEFSGTASADGRSFPIAGDRLISGSVQEHHPADSNRDHQLVLTELTAYAAAWKNGGNTSEAIPVIYVTHAAMLWRNGEAYHFVATNPAPGCWVPNASPVRSLANTVESTAVRTCSAQTSPNSTVEVDISVQPRTGVGAYALEEQIPAGWVPSNISDDGVFDSSAGIIRWGLFFDAAARNLKYTLTPPPGVTSIAELHGDFSFDGEQVGVSGTSRIISSSPAGSVVLTHCEKTAEGAIHLKLAGAAGQVCVLEASSDLQSWSFVEEVFLPDGSLDIDDPASQAQSRFYRLRIR